MDTDALRALIDEQRRFFATGRTSDLSFRLEQLSRLKELIVQNEARIFDALHADFRKPPFEVFATEVSFLTAELDHTRKHLRRWARPEKVATPLILQPGRSYVYREPLGVVLIIGPWNYPFQLMLSPLIAALAAGNTAILKPSEIASHTSSLIADLVAKYFDRSLVAVVEGGVPETTALLAQRFDHIFFTGSTRVGQVVMEAAAKHLTPVTLELGGKSPCIVDRDAKIDLAARRIVWGKFVNAGQTCVAPDYLLVHREVKDALIDRIKHHVAAFYGEEPRTSPDYPRIIDDRNFERVRRLMGEGRVVVGGSVDPAERYIAPTVLEDVPLGAPVMQEEIFGPILPVFPIDDVGEAVRFVQARPKPLALYLFSQSAATQERVMRETTSGGSCINDTLVHLAAQELPFGGVGPSGLGSYHGKHGFETFSHRKGVVKKSTWLDLWFRYAPYKDNIRFLRLLQ